MTTPKLLSIQVARAQPLLIEGKPILSAIEKTNVSGAVTVKPLGLDGDEQADLSVHGGLSKAVYAYPSEHYPYWREQQSLLGLDNPLPYGPPPATLSDDAEGALLAEVGAQQGAGVVVPASRGGVGDGPSAGGRRQQARH